MMAFTRPVFVLILLVFLSPHQIFAQLSSAYDTAERRWTLRNDLAEATFRLDPDGHFLFEKLRSLRNSDAWTASNGGSNPILVKLSTEHYDENTTYRLVTHSKRGITRNGYRTSIVLDDTKRHGRFFVDIDMHSGSPTVRIAQRFRNIQSSPVELREADPLPISFSDDGRTYRGFRVSQWWGGGYGGNFETSLVQLQNETEMGVYSGAYGQQCSWAALRDNLNRGLFVGWEFNGRALATLIHLPTEKRVQFHIVPEEFRRTVAAGGDHTLPPAFFGLFRGDWEEAGYQTQRYVESAIAVPSPDEQFPYVVWDSWDYDLAINEDLLRRNADIAARLGIELFVVDLGWARSIGDWYEDPKKFPSGLRALSNYVHSLGMKFGLHFAFAEAHQDSPILRENPDWRSSQNYHYFGADSLCLGHRPVRDWLLSQTLRLIDDYRLDWILQDGENMVKFCNKETHTHGPEDSNISGAENLDYLVDNVRRLRPNVQWENCSDGGNMMTYGMARRYVTSITSDNSGPMTTRQAIYGASYPFPPRYLDRYMPDTKLTPYITRSYMFGGPWIFMNRLPDMRPADIALATSEVTTYKQLRGKIRTGKVFHLTPRPEEDRVDALESYDAASDSAVVFVYRPSLAPASIRLRIRGLRRENVYTVRYQDSGFAGPPVRGAQLLDEGIVVDLPTPLSAAIIYVTPEN
ncbi:MAG: alpha-galactosidase [Acidobacteria bacterium]|nr:alpha-galactosidase [Acidobacteriota bacterium]